MSYSSQSDRGCDSDSEFSVAASNGTEVQDCTRQSQPQIQGNTWVLHGQVTVDQLHAHSNWMAVGLASNVENVDRITKINTLLQHLFGAQFEYLFGKLIENVMYFVVFCNLIDILDS